MGSSSGVSMVVDTGASYKRGAAGIAAAPMDEMLWLLDGGVNGELVEGRVGDLIALDLRAALKHVLQRLQHFWVRLGIVCLSAFLAIPQADRDHFGAARAGERDLVLETLLLAQHREHELLECLVEIVGAVGFQIDFDDTCEQWMLLR